MHSPGWDPAAWEWGDPVWGDCPRWPLPTPTRPRSVQSSSLALEVLKDILHIPQLRVQPPPIALEGVQLPPQVAQVVLKEGFQVVPGDTQVLALLLQQGPLGLQHFILLLQEADLSQSKKAGGLVPSPGPRRDPGLDPSSPLCPTRTS